MVFGAAHKKKLSFWKNPFAAQHSAQLEKDASSMTLRGANKKKLSFRRNLF